MNTETNPTPAPAETAKALRGHMQRIPEGAIIFATGDPFADVVARDFNAMLDAHEATQRHATALDTESRTLSTEAVNLRVELEALKRNGEVMRQRLSAAENMIASKVLDRAVLIENAAMNALDAIAKLCGCAEWDYGGQVVRDVIAVVGERDTARADLTVATAAHAEVKAALVVEQRACREARKVAEDLREALRDYATIETAGTLRRLEARPFPWEPAPAERKEGPPYEWSAEARKGLVVGATVEWRMSSAPGSIGERVTVARVDDGGEYVGCADESTRTLAHCNPATLRPPATAPRVFGVGDLCPIVAPKQKRVDRFSATHYTVVRKDPPLKDDWRIQWHESGIEQTIMEQNIAEDILAAPWSDGGGGE